MPLPEWLLPTLLPNVGGIAGGILTRNEIEGWYKDLRKPWFNPPKWVFGPAWTSLYTGMGYASYLVWRDGGGFEGSGRDALMLYAGQLFLNWIWTPLFFKMHRIDLAMLDITLLTGAVGACAAAFYKVNPLAGYLMVPYLAWVSFASLLTFRIWRDNPQNGKKGGEKKEE